LRGDRAKQRRLILLVAACVVAACGLVYELVAGAVSSYLLGDAVTQYSLVVGTYLCAMGIGSWLARFVRHEVLSTLVLVELLLALFGGLSGLFTFAVGAWLMPWFIPLFYGQLLVIGALVGVEIPLLVRLIRTEERDTSHTVSDVLALDYMGALLGSLAFPLLVLPLLGMSKSSLVFGLLNLLVAALLVPMLEKPRWTSVVLTAAILLGALFGSGRIVRHVEDAMYQDTVVYTEQTPYQRIVLTRWRDDLRLYIDGHIQFSSIDEARYHEALVVPAMSAVPHPARVLVLGGGDGLAVRRILRHPAVTTVDVVDLDPAITGLARSWPGLAALNGGALDDPRVSVHHTDAMAFVEDSDQTWDVVLIDLPDPHSPTLAKLYTTAFYSSVARRLSRGGVLATQASSPFYAREAYWSIVGTIEATSPDHPGGALVAWPYHHHVPSFGEWGFVLASRRTLEPDQLTPTLPTEVFDAPTLRAMFLWDKDLAMRPDVGVNTLDDPVVATYYNRGWRTFND